MQLLSFGGTQIFRPGAYSVVNVKSNTPYTAGSLKTLAIIGSGTGGQPGVPLYFNSPTLAAQKIGGTDAVLAAQIAWEHGADLICFVLTDQATQATYAIQSTDVTPVTLVTLQGLRWNTSDNALKYTAAAAAGGKQTITITDTSVTPNVVETYTLTDTAAGITAFVQNINNNSSLVSAVQGTAVTTTNTAATVGTAASFTGGTRSAGTATQISNAINALQTEDVQGIIPTATDSTTLTTLDAHCNTMSNVVNRRERRCFVGQPVGTSVAAYTATMQTIGGRSTLVAPGIYRNVGSLKTLVSSAFTAAAIAGIWAGNPNPNMPITFDYINALGLEFNYLNSDLQTLITGQVTAIESVPKRGFRVVRALTGDNSGTNLVELSVADLVDVMTRSVREQLEDRFVGNASYATIVHDITQTVSSALASFKKQGWILDGVDQFGNALPAYRNITVTQAGTQYVVAYEISPCEPVNYITITSTVNA